jgi:hypothetical protein
LPSFAAGSAFGSVAGSTFGSVAGSTAGGAAATTFFRVGENSDRVAMGSNWGIDGSRSCAPFQIDESDVELASIDAGQRARRDAAEVDDGYGLDDQEVNVESRARVIGEREPRARREREACPANEHARAAAEALQTLWPDFRR